MAQTSKQRNRTQLLGGINQAATDPMGQLFFAAFDQSQRTAVVFVARVGYLRAGARVVSHQALKPFTQILAISRVLPTRLSTIGSATALRQPMDTRMADGVLRREGRAIGRREAGEPTAELCIYLVRLHPNTTQRRVALCLDVLERANLHAHAEGGSHDSSPFISRVSGYRYRDMCFGAIKNRL